MSACGGGESSQTAPGDLIVGENIVGENIGGDGDVFDKNRLLDIQITLSPADFEVLRNQGRTLASTARKCVPEYEYHEFEATVSVDGDTINKVMVRKKGFLGSLSPTRPSLKLDFDDIIEGQTYQHRKRMTLNNNRQDVSNARQCMAYDYFRKAGLVAPRCNFARVTVNGEFLGIYTHLEPIKKPFLQDNYGDNDGNLYEAQLTDFGEFLNEKFEKKTNETENDRSDLELVSDVLALPEAEFAQSIEAVIDVEEFIRFWAMETLLGHWDSASGNGNNFYIYRSPVDNLFHFIPWGADASFSGIHLFKPDSGPLYRNFRLASRLYAIDTYRQQYLDTLNEYLNTIWNEDEFEEELNRIATLTQTNQEDLSLIRHFVLGNGEVGDADYIQSQRERLAKAISGQEPVGVEHLLTDEQAVCDTPPTTQLQLNASSVNNVDTGDFYFTLPSGHLVNASITLASINVDSIVSSKQEMTNPAVMSLLIVGADVNDNYTPYVLQVFIEEPQFVGGGHQLHGFATNVLLFEVDNSLPLGIKTLALGEQGTITLSNININDEQIDVEIAIDSVLEYGSESNKENSLENSNQ